MGRWMILSLFLVVACTRGEQASVTASPSPAATPRAPDVTPAARRSGSASPMPDVSASPDADSESDDEDEREDVGTDFTVEATASTYSGYVPKTVAFRAFTTNGTPPLKFVWQFDDGSFPVAGDSIIHTFTKPGIINVFVTARDATGASSTGQVILFLLSREDWAARHGGAPDALPSETPWTSPTPDVTPLPPDFMPLPSLAKPKPSPTS